MTSLLLEGPSPNITTHYSHCVNSNNQDISDSDFGWNISPPLKNQLCVAGNKAGSVLSSRMVLQNLMQRSLQPGARTSTWLVSPFMCKHLRLLYAIQLFLTQASFDKRFIASNVCLVTVVNNPTYWNSKIFHMNNLQEWVMAVPFKQTHPYNPSVLEIKRRMVESGIWFYA